MFLMKCFIYQVLHIVLVHKKRCVKCLYFTLMENTFSRLLEVHFYLNQSSQLFGHTLSAHRWDH